MRVGACVHAFMRKCVRVRALTRIVAYFLENDLFHG